jgi:hypothetical protein
MFSPGTVSLELLSAAETKLMKLDSAPIPPLIDGIVGVIGNEPSWDEGGPRLVALLIGRNMPASDIEVAK